MRLCKDNRNATVIEIFVSPWHTSYLGDHLSQEVAPASECTRQMTLIVLIVGFYFEFGVFGSSIGYSVMTHQYSPKSNEFTNQGFQVALVL